MPPTPVTAPARRRFWWMGPVLAVLLMGGLVEAGVAWLKRMEWERQNLRFHAQAQHIQEEAAQEVGRIGDLMRSAQALFLDGREPDQARWEAFARDVELTTRYPAIRTIQWVPRVPRKGLPAFEARMRRIHGADFRVWSLPGGKEAPLPEAEEYYPIALVHPLGFGQRGLGFDVYSRAATRQQVVDVIQRKNAMRIGSKVDLVEEPGLIAFGITGGVFEHAQGQGQEDGRHLGELRGLISGMFDARRFFGAISSSQQEPMAFAVFEGTGAQAAAQIFSNLPSSGAQQVDHERFSSLTFHGRTWTFRFQSTPAWEAAQPAGSAGVARVLGWALTLTLGLLVAVLVLSREKALALAREQALELETRSAELRRQSMENFASERAREDLLVVVNHGLRTPLTALRGALSVLAEEPGPTVEAKRDMLGQAQRNAERALVLVNDLLDLHRMEQGKLPLEVADLNLHTTLQEVIQGVESLAVAQGRPMRLECPHTLRVQGDPKRLQQVVNNLIANALRYGQRGTPVRIWAEEASGGRVRISVHNLGEPLPESVRMKVFGLSKGLSSTGTRLTGLGLLIAKGLTEAMRGTMGHVSVEGGNTFWMELPGKA